jgi:hypothetical protein
LLDPPAGWRGGFDLVLESLTVQSLPRQLRPAAIARVRELVAPGGTLPRGTISALRPPDARVGPGIRSRSAGGAPR